MKYSRTQQPIRAGLSRWLLVAVVLACCHNVSDHVRAQSGSYVDAVASVQPKIVKIYGAGGVRGLEAYQSGFLISKDGHILTVWSYVLDSDQIIVILNDGRRFAAELVGAYPQMDIAVLKIDTGQVEHFTLKESVELNSGRRVLAFSNLFGVATGDEPASVLHGVVSAVSPLNTRRGAFASAFRGDVYIVDAMTNNPGAAGGALTDGRGQIAGLVGKELRNSADNTWLNYAIPIGKVAPAVSDIIAGKAAPRRIDDPTAKKPNDSLTLQALGIVLVPDVLDKTPPYVDSVIPQSPAAKAKIGPDDLILFVNGRIASSVKAVKNELEFIDRIDAVKLTIQRKQELTEVELRLP